MSVRNPNGRWRDPFPDARSRSIAVISMAPPDLPRDVALAAGVWVVIVGREVVVNDHVTGVIVPPPAAVAPETVTE